MLKQFLQVLLQFPCSYLCEFLRLEVETGQEVLLGQSGQHASPVAVQDLVVEELEVVEATCDCCGRGGRRVLPLPAADAV